MARQVSIALSHEATAWYAGLGQDRKAIVDAALRGFALNPQGAGVRTVSPEGRPVFVAFIPIDDTWISGYRIDFAIDEVMNKHIPAIAIRSARKINR